MSYDSLADQIKVPQGALPPPLVPQTVSGSGCNSSAPAPPTPPLAQVLTEGPEVPLHTNVSVSSELKEQERKIQVLHEDPIPPPPLPPRLPTPARMHMLKKDPLLPPLPPRPVPVPDKIDILEKVSCPPRHPPSPLTLERPVVKKSSPPTNPPPLPQDPSEPLPHTGLCYFLKESSFPPTPAPGRPPQPLSHTSSVKVLSRAPTPPRPLTMTTQLSVFLVSAAPSTVWMAQHVRECGCQGGLFSPQSF